MKVLEIKNNLVKIAYDVKDNLLLSSFLIIEDGNMPYVGQVVNLKADVAANFAIVKLLFTFNEEGILKNYNGSIPSLKSNISVLPSNELLDILPIETPVIIGQLAQQGVPLKIDKSLFESNLTVCSNSLENTNLLIHNFLKQFDQISQKAVVFDLDGDLNLENKLYIGEDFKFPLNYDSINFIYENDLSDVDPTSKAIIQDIFLEVQDYVKTIPENYIPFNTFVDVVDQQYKATAITELVLLKNKLLKYRDQNVFAQTLKDVLNLSLAIEKSNTIAIDISSVDTKMQREIILYVYDLMEKINSEIYSFIKLDNDNASKKLLKRFVNKINVSTTVICTHEFKYLPELKQAAENLILFAPLTHQHDFAAYNTFLNKLNSDEFIIYGNLTQSIPLIVQLEEIEVIKAIEEESERLEIEAVQEEISSVIDESDKFVDETSFDNFSETPTEELEITLNSQLEISDKNEIEEVPSNEEVFEEEPESASIPERLIQEEIGEMITEEPLIEELTSFQSLQIIEEPDLEEISLNEELNIEPEIDFSEETEDIFHNQPEIIENEIEQLSTEELTEDDLDLIDDLSQETTIYEPFEIIDSFEPEEEPSIEEEPITVPIYDADDIEYSNVSEFEQGEVVTHPKYGRGLVEKMIKYGNKTLCSINFDNIGRRLLDPAISEITRID